MAQLTVATVNVNGIRAAHRKGMVNWLAQRNPDVVLLQEVRAPEELVGPLLGEGWELVQQACEIKGRAGVAIASKLPLTDVKLGLTEGIAVDTGRWVEATVQVPGTDGSTSSLRLVSAYIHSGTAGTPKMDEKYAFLDVVTPRMAEIFSQYDDALVAGDINIAHHTNDIKNWKGNLKAAGFLPEERAYLDVWFDQQGWVDVQRAVAGDVPGPYTWWSNRGQAFDNDAGWRIDYQIASPGLFGRVGEVAVDRAPSYDTRWSDHAPLVVTYQF